jgi:hypothetical protein
MSLVEMKARYQVAPIILTGGIASMVTGNAVSLLTLTQPNLLPMAGNDSTLRQNLITALQLNNPSFANAYLPPDNDLDDAFGAFTVLPGGTLCVNTVPKYPLASMTMAANAIVREPINISLIWDTPMRGPNAWISKLTTMIALKAVLDLHNNAGGMYTVMTPAFYYDNLILTSLADNSRGGNPLPQNAWRFDFERPMIVTTDDVTADLNMLTSLLTRGVKTVAKTSGPATSAPGGAGDPANATNQPGNIPVVGVPLTWVSVPSLNVPTPADGSPIFFGLSSLNQ